MPSVVEEYNICCASATRELLDQATEAVCVLNVMMNLSLNQSIAEARNVRADKIGVTYRIR